MFGSGFGLRVASWPLVKLVIDSNGVRFLFFWKKILIPREFILGFEVCDGIACKRVRISHCSKDAEMFIAFLTFVPDEVVSVLKEFGYRESQASS